MNIAQRERQLYEQVWNDYPAYGDFSPGERYLPAFLDMLRQEKLPCERATVLDAGCGSGKGALALLDAGFLVTGFDVTREGLTAEAALRFTCITGLLWDDLRTVPGERDYVYCCDVLEHIPPQFTMLVVQRLLEAAVEGVFLSISLVPDTFGLFVGQPLHQTVQPYSWWAQNLATLAEVIEMRDLGVTGLYFLRGAANDL